MGKGIYSSQAQDAGGSTAMAEGGSKKARSGLSTYWATLLDCTTPTMSVRCGCHVTPPHPTPPPPPHTHTPSPHPPCHGQRRFQWFDGEQRYRYR